MLTSSIAVDDSAAGDLLAGALWTCASLPPGTADAPDQLDTQAVRWLPATVPGTAAQALDAAGLRPPDHDDQAQLDGCDWWFRTTVDTTGAEPGEWTLDLAGLATLCDVWLGGEHLLHSENMFVPHQVPGLRLDGETPLLLRFAALDAALAARHPRPGWKSRLVRSQSLRWYRTSLLGRMPAWSPWAAPVGPWRPVSLRRSPVGVALGARWQRATCHGEGGEVEVRLELHCPDGPPREVRLLAGDTATNLDVQAADGCQVAAGTAILDHVQRWWPHSHGAQPLYRLALDVDGTVLPLGSVGFRELTVDRTGGAFRFRVNDVPVFCRGVCWNGADPLSLSSAAEDVREQLMSARALGINMIRVPGYATYEDDAFWNACDELGLLVWQDCMIASVDPPQTDDYAATMVNELEHVLTPLQGRPALALVCGSSESHQQGSMFGLTAAELHNALLDDVIPAAVQRLLPGTPYLPSTPTGDDLPFGPDEGVCHYFGVGAYLRPLHDARDAGVRFAAECLSFATPPDRETVDESFGGAALAGHDPRWKRTTARDGGASWDFEDVRDHYVREIFGVDPMLVRYADPELALDYGRAAVAEAAQAVLSTWRREESSCAGALILTWRDAWPGAGWGLIDAAGRAKAPSYVLPRVLASTAIFFSDDGLAGLRLHLARDEETALAARVRITLFSPQGAALESGESSVELLPRTVQRLSVQQLLGGFRDLTRAYRFVPSAYDVVRAELLDPQDQPLRETCFLPDGPTRPRLPDVGLTAVADRDPQGAWQLTVSTTLFAQWVAVHVPGFRPGDSWFHLAPGCSRTLPLLGDTERTPRGSVRALNSHRVAHLEVRT